MWTPDERTFFLEHGYLHARQVLTPDLLSHLQREFDRISALEGDKHVNQHQLLKYQTFIDLLEYEPILGRHKAIFGEQIQLLQYDFLRQGPRSGYPQRIWHRDFVHPGDIPLAINTLIYLDEMTPERGPTYVLPGSHRGWEKPPKDKVFGPLPGEVPVFANAGDAVFVNAAIWHSGSRNDTDGLRRAIYMYFGYWWMKPYEADQQRPYPCLVNASEQRLQLLGYKMPAADLHQYPEEPDVW